MATPSELPCDWWSPEGIGSGGWVWAAGLGGNKALLGAVGSGVDVGGGVRLGWMEWLGGFGLGGVGFVRIDRCGARRSSLVILYLSLASWMVCAESWCEKKWMVYTHCGFS